MIFAVPLFLLGLALSAFFSGTETGMYRVSRIRLVLDGLSGSLPARGMVWLLNTPAVFVASTLLGNNVANYLTSLAVVLGMQHLLHGGAASELLGTMLMTPVVFVGGELLPKYLFYHAPYRLLHAVRPLVLFFTILFLPISLLLGLLARALRYATGETPFRIRLGMARRELDQVLREGHEAGILAGSQRALAQNVFQVGNMPAVRFGVPPTRLASVSVDAGRDAVLAAARRSGNPIILVYHGSQLTGFLRYADLLYEPTRAITPMPVVSALVGDKHLSVLLRMVEVGSDVAALKNRGGQIHSIVTRRQLLQPLLATPAV